MTPRADSGAEVAERLIAAFSAADVEAMREMLDDGLTAYVTNSDGGMDEVTGRDLYLERIEAMNLPSSASASSSPRSRCRSVTTRSC